MKEPIGCTFCGSDKHMTRSCPMREKALTATGYQLDAALAGSPRRIGESDEAYRARVFFERGHNADECKRFAGEREAFQRALHEKAPFKLTADRIAAAEWAWQARAVLERQKACEVCQGDGCFPFDSPCVECNGTGLEQSRTAQPAPVASDGCKRFADKCEECDGVFVGHSGVTKWCPYCGARHKGATVQLNAAQPAPVVPEGWKDGLWRYGFNNMDFGMQVEGPYVLLEQVEKALAAAPSPTQTAPVVPDGWRELLDRVVPRLDAGGPNPIDPDVHHCEWTLYQERERIHAEFAELAAAPAQGQQVECQECERLRSEVEAVAIRLRQTQVKHASELAALKAQQVGQEPVAWGAFHFGGKRDGKLYSHCETEADVESYILDVHRSNDWMTLRKGPLYTKPQSAPAQDVAGWIPVSERLPDWRTERSRVQIWTKTCGQMVASMGGPINDEGDFLPGWTWQVINDIEFKPEEVTHWKPLAAAPADHDKQSGGEV